jgi:alkylhydroperoxidase family enzyme
VAYLRLQGESDAVAKAIAVADLDAASAAGLEAPRRAMLELAEKLTRHAYKITPEDAEGLRQHGYSDEQIAELIYDAALFNFFNKVADAFGIEGRGLHDLPMDQLIQATAQNRRAKSGTLSEQS